MKHGNMDPALLAIRREAAFALCCELARESGIPAHCIAGYDKDPLVVPWRHRLWAMLHDTGLSYLAIGQIVGRHHTTILQAVRNWRERQAAVCAERDEPEMQECAQ